MKNESKRKSCDLHTHSRYSDGTYTPRELLEAADNIGLSAIVLCDHNTVSGLDEFVREGENFCAEAVPGIELSTEWRGKELHIIGLYINPSHYDKINDLVDEMRREKTESYRKCVKSLNRAGYNIDYEQLMAATDCGINRAHIARELLRLGYVDSVKEAFSGLISKTGGHYTAPKYISSLDAIRFLKSIGAVAVWAHPYLSLDANQVREFLPLFKEAGLDAMETVYPTYDEQTTNLARETALEFGILESGGSDFHCPVKPGIELGVGRGNLFVPSEFHLKLKDKLKQI